MSVKTPSDLLNQLQDLMRRKAMAEHLPVEEINAWLTFLKLYEPVVRKFVGRHGRALRKSQREDLIQDIWFDLVRSLRTFKYDRSKGRFCDWLERLVKRRTIDAILRLAGRGRERRPQIADASDLGHAIDSKAVDPADALERNWNLAKVHAAIDDARSKFSDRDYRIFRRTVIDEVALAEVAEEFDVSLDNAKQIAGRFKRRVKEILKSNYGRRNPPADSL